MPKRYPTLKELIARRDALDAQLEAARSEQREEALQTIRALMNEHGLTIDHLARAKTTKATATASGHKRGVQPPKYRDPATGATWSGLARPPAWIASVKDRSKFLIDGATE